MTSCRICGKSRPGPLPALAIARLNGPRVRDLTLRVLRGTTLHLAKVRDLLCRKCSDDHTREVIDATREVAC
jgi:hypothetical protein